MNYDVPIMININDLSSTITIIGKEKKKEKMWINTLTHPIKFIHAIKKNSYSYSPSLKILNVKVKMGEKWISHGEQKVNNK